MTAGPELTVVVPTRDRAAVLPQALAALVAQTLGPEEYAILVVDDGSAAPAAVERAVASEPRARLIRQPWRGLSAARNFGARTAGTPYVLFTDDDCVPRPDWAALLLAALRAGSPVVLGPTVAGDPTDRLAVASQVVADAPAHERDGALPRLFAPGSNLGCRADVIGAVPFDDHYAGVFAEDRDWIERVRDAGFRVDYVASALVRHFPDLTFRRAMAKSVRYGRGSYRFRRRHRSGRLARPRFYAGLIARGFAAGPAVGLLVCASQVATAAGYVCEAALRRRTPAPTREAGTPSE